jgi:polyphosphate kinase
MIRVAGLLNQRDSGIVAPALGGLDPESELQEIHRIVHPLRMRQWQIWTAQIQPELEQNGILILRYDELSASEQDSAKTFFERFVLPVLTPLMVDPTHPFPFISNLSLNFAIILRRAHKEGVLSEKHFARLKIPPGLKRFVKIDDDMMHNSFTSQSTQDGAGLPTTVRLVLIEDVIRANLGLLFPGMVVEEAHLFRVTRDADVEIAEDEAGDLLETMEKATRQRRFGQVVRVTVQPGAGSIAQLLLDAFEIEPFQLQELPFMGYSSLWEIANLSRPELSFPNFVPRVPEAIQRANGDVFAAAREGDVLISHPFDSFSPTVAFFAQAAKDPSVVAIKATLYRVGANSPIVAHLLEAAQNDTEVTVLVELKARFDEKSNIMWAKTLEAAGVHVVYGVKLLKTHAKLALAIRRENTPQGQILRPYCHLSTGNYNHTTAKFYTDLSLITAREDFGSDLIRLFNRLTAIAPSTTYTRLLIAPEFMRDWLISLIDREIQHGKKCSAHVRIKCNTLTDPALITKLYEASHAGVKIELIVRGVCCLRPGVKDISENISVSSVVGRFLEHSRVIWVRNGGEPEVFIGSADLMARNLERRVESYFPILDPAGREWIEKWIFELTLSDNLKRRVLQSDGSWARVPESLVGVNCQESAIQQLVKKHLDFDNRPVDGDGPAASLKKLVKAATKRLV